MSEAVLILNFGAPENRVQLKPFLLQMFQDTEGLRMGMPAVLQKLLSHVIVARRMESSARRYDSVGWSPLVRETRSFTKKLEKRSGVPVYCASRYGSPCLDEVLNKMQSDGVKSINVISLYPQFSYSTTGSAFSYLQTELKKYSFSQVRFLVNWGDRQSWLQRYSQYIHSFCPEDGEHKLLFCAHSLPLSYLDQGDPYYVQLKNQVSYINADSENMLCFQSKTGPAKWLEPDIRQWLEQYSGSAKHLYLVPMSFCFENLETLWDLDKEVKEELSGHGFEVTRIPCPGNEDWFCDFFAELVSEKKSEDNSWINPDEIKINGKLSYNQLLK